MEPEENDMEMEQDENYMEMEQEENEMDLGSNFRSISTSCYKNIRSYASDSSDDDEQVLIILVDY